MRAFSITELLRLTTNELCDLIKRVSNQLEEHLGGSDARAKALLNLQLIRTELTRREFSP